MFSPSFFCQLLATRFGREIPYFSISLIRLSPKHSGGWGTLVWKFSFCKFTWPSYHMPLWYKYFLNETTLLFDGTYTFVFKFCLGFAECSLGVLMWNGYWHNKAFFRCKVQWHKAHCIFGISWGPLQTGISVSTVCNHLLCFVCSCIFLRLLIESLGVWLYFIWMFAYPFLSKKNSSETTLGSKITVYFYNSPPFVFPASSSHQPRSSTVLGFHVIMILQIIWLLDTQFSRPLTMNHDFGFSVYFFLF